MNNLESIRLSLKKYLTETPKDVLKKKFDEFNQASFEGVTVNEYFSRFSEQYTFFDNKHNTTEAVSNTFYGENLLWYDIIVANETISVHEIQTKVVTDDKTDNKYNNSATSYAMAA